AAEGDASRYLPDPAALLATYDAQVRGRLVDNVPDGVRAERDGPLLRFVGAKHGGFVDYRDLAGLEGAELDELIARQVRVFAAREEEIWQDGRGWLVDSLEAERAVDPDAITIVVAEAGDTAVCAAWVRFTRGTEFATLWGGGTLPAWRGRGIYRAIVAYRANLAALRGFRYLQVDASADSRPILERLGFVAVTTTTPFIWSPRR